MYACIMIWLENVIHITLTEKAIDSTRGMYSNKCISKYVGACTSGKRITTRTLAMCIHMKCNSNLR